MTKLEEIYEGLQKNWNNNYYVLDVIAKRQADQITCEDQIEKILSVMDAVLEANPDNERIRTFRNDLRDWQEHIKNKKPIIRKGKRKALEPVRVLIDIDCILSEKKFDDTILQKIAHWAAYETNAIEQRLIEYGPCEYKYTGSEQVLEQMRKAYLAV